MAGGGPSGQNDRPVSLMSLIKDKAPCEGLCLFVGVQGFEP